MNTLSKIATAVLATALLSTAGCGGGSSGNGANPPPPPPPTGGITRIIAQLQKEKRPAAVSL